MGSICGHFTAETRLKRLNMVATISGIWASVWGQRQFTAETRLKRLITVAMISSIWVTVWGQFGGV